MRKPELTNDGYQARIECDSISPRCHRLTTFVVRFPRSILAEVNTHRMLSRNSASSRAIPTKVLLERARTEPYIPATFTKNGKGMSSNAPAADQDACREAWLRMRGTVCDGVELALGLGIHKQDLNRALEPWLWHECILTGTDWSNFFFQRVHPDAHPAFQTIAEMMARLYLGNDPDRVKSYGWHLPFVTDEEKADPDLTKICPLPPALPAPPLTQIATARCARVSYGRHGAADIENDLRWFKEHVLTPIETGAPLHASPMEHVAEALVIDCYRGNVRGWLQLRKHFHQENRTSFTSYDLEKYQAGKEAAP